MHQKDKTYLIPIIAFAIFAAFFLFILYNAISLKSIDPSDLETITSRLLSPPEIEFRRGTRNINLNIESYPKHEFVIGSSGFDAFYNPRGFAKTAEIGDTVSIRISKAEYQKTISSTKQRQFISVYELKYKNYPCLTLSAYNEESLQDKLGGIILFSVLSIIMLWLCIKYLRMYLKQ